MSAKAQHGGALIFPVGQAVSFDPAAFDDAIRSQGVQFVHWRSMRCPVGMVDKYDHRRPHDDHSGCSNGFIYTRAGIVTALFTGNTYENRQQDVGLMDGSTVQVTTPRFYDDSGQEVRVVPFDRFYLQEEDITVEHWELVEAHVTGKDKLKFPIVRVVDIIDARNHRYEPGDYSVQSGQLVWGASAPGFNALLNKGVIYSCRYEYSPFWYVQRIGHQVRVAQVETQLERTVMRMPQSLTLQREYAFEKSDNDDQADIPPDEPYAALRQVKSPRDGAYGPR